MPDASVATPSPAVRAGAVEASVRAGMDRVGVARASVVVVSVRTVGRERPALSRGGRIAAAAALDALGIAGRPGRDEHGRPVWPAGTTGAVSHGAGLAIAACAPIGSVAAGACTLGVDVERADAVGARVATRITVDGDHGPVGVREEDARAVRFSAKESAYKSLSFASAPSLAGFSFVQVAVACHADGTFDATAPDGRRCRGTWAVVHGLAVTVAVHRT